jgi:hypothetical protein
MSRDAEAKVDPKTARLYDKRTFERNIKKGLITRKDYEKHMKGLEDVANKGVFGGPENDVADELDEAVAMADDEADEIDDDEADDTDEPENDVSGPVDGTGNSHES